VILATTSQDVLTGGAAQDQFVFAPTSSGPSVQHTITDFLAGVDKVDVRQFSNISASALPTETQQGSDTLITLDSHDTLLLKNIAVEKHRCRKPARQRRHLPCLDKQAEESDANRYFSETQRRMLLARANMRADAHAAQAARARFEGVPIRHQREHHDRGETGPPSSTEYGRKRRHGTSERIRRFGRSVSEEGWQPSCVRNNSCRTSASPDVNHRRPSAV
jgi:hypothetical protein